jgi:anti-sigma factor ChrR (cupin superfamily)
MSAVTPNAGEHAGLAPLASRFVEVAKLPDHKHVLIEQTYVLEGSLVCGEGECKAGEFVWRPAGSRHEAWGKALFR